MNPSTPLGQMPELSPFSLQQTKPPQAFNELLQGLLGKGGAELLFDSLRNDL